MSPSLLNSAPFIHQPRIFQSLPQSIFYLTRTMPSNTIYPLHSHPWGEFVYSYSGVLELQAEGAFFRLPANYGLWLPPGVEHKGLNRHSSFHCSLYIEPGLAQEKGMLSTACALTINTMVRAMLDYLRLNPPEAPYSAEESRLLEVILDQLVVASCAGSYLPVSNDPVLSKVLAYLEAQPGDNCSVRVLAERVGTSERTLARKAQKELSMSLSEWRQRLKVVCAMPMLEEGYKVESIALDLGYSTASAFIAMFRRLVDMTPDEYRKQAS